MSEQKEAYKFIVPAFIYEAVESGLKTVELVGILEDTAVGDWIRYIHEENLEEIKMRIVAINEYKNLRCALEEEDYLRVLPTSGSLFETLMIYRKRIGEKGKVFALQLCPF